MSIPAHLSEDEFKYVFSHNRATILQQILASPHGVLSLPELSYRNPNVSRSTLRYHLDVLREYELVTRRPLPEDDREPGLPWVFWAVTPAGVEVLRATNLVRTLGLLYQIYETVKFPDKQDEIRELDPPTPDWYSEIGLLDGGNDNQSETITEVADE